MTSLTTLSACAAGLLALAPAAPAAAHVTLERPEAPRGAPYKAVFKVPHGCDGSPTQALRVEIPEGFINVKPMPKPGWTLETQRGPYAASYTLYGRTLTEGVREIHWSEGDLPDAFYDEFVAAGFLAGDLEPGTALYFKATQICAEGERRWVEVPDGSASHGHKLASPAAILRIAAEPKATAAAEGANEAGTATIGALAVEGAWSRASAGGAKVGAGYLTIRNTGAEADTLVSVATPVAGRSEIHDMTMTDGVMRMRALPEGLEIPAGGSITLEPGGKHLMFLDLKEPLAAGARVPVTLTFKSGATGKVVLPVRPIGGDAGKHDDGHDHHHDHDQHHHHH